MNKLWWSEWPHVVAYVNAVHWSHWLWMWRSQSQPKSQLVKMGKHLSPVLRGRDWATMGTGRDWQPFGGGSVGKQWSGVCQLLTDMIRLRKTQQHCKKTWSDSMQLARCSPQAPRSQADGHSSFWSWQWPLMWRWECCLRWACLLSGGERSAVAAATSSSGDSSVTFSELTLSPWSRSVCTSLTQAQATANVAAAKTSVLKENK